jgi:hypothetical protein
MHERDLMAVEHHMYPLEQIAVAYNLALFEQQICTLAKKMVRKSSLQK